MFLSWPLLVRLRKAQDGTKLCRKEDPMSWMKGVARLVDLATECDWSPRRFEQQKMPVVPLVMVFIRYPDFSDGVGTCSATPQKSRPSLPGTACTSISLIPILSLPLCQL